ncbi:electron transport protein SCO1/SenC [Nocardioides sp. Root1257]|uniref:SCO family protein n=1 Tax=unclassified Nocardioides TaxID=2615069 RepID=UPI0006FA9568|nr:MULTISPECIES: SCO family protein [unclassified Nocardioides]KQW53294.1 electron transport protein SCO1/SenC [Nocardioides sp. Root1257]KRC55980.1 electron transport protein SCO1/SenC [Nocardioides sp. Root224]
MRSRVAVVLTALLLPLAACGSSEPTGPSGLHGNELDPPFEVSATPLTDTDGQPFSLTKDTDKPLTMVFYGYTHCPDICQTVMSNLASAMTRLDDQDRERVDVVFVTTDPARDTQDVLKKYLSHFDPGFIGLTGDLDTIVSVAQPMGVGITQGEKLPSGGYDVTHGTTITGIDADDEGTVYWSEETSSADFAADIHHLLDAD